MFASLGLTISGLVFTSLIAIIYLTKKRYYNIQNTLFKILLLLTIVIFDFEIYCVYLINIRESVPLLLEIVTRIYILGMIYWFALVAIYVWVLGQNDDFGNGKSLIKQPFVNAFLSCALIAFIVSCFFPFTYTSGVNNELNVVGGPAVNSLYGIFVPVGLTITYIMFKYRKKTSLFMQAPIWFFMIGYVSMYVIQYFYTDINDMTFMFGLTIVAAYFTIVSQDYKLVGDLEIAKKEAEKANKDKTDFLSKMSHEIRTPMNTIMGLSSAIQTDSNVDEARIREDVSNIYLCGNNLITTINNILDFSKLDSNKEHLDEKEYFIGDIVYELISFVNARIDKSKVKFNVNVEEKIPKLLYGDKQKIYKVLLNIINNSIKYTMAGEINLNISAICENNICHLTFEVKDSGIGIKESDYNKIFVSFAKIDNSSHAIENGAGLGLSICKKLLELMEGTISYESEYGIGTTFIIRLDNKIVDYNPCGNFIKDDVNKQITSSDRVNCNGKKVLVVDDNEINLKVAKVLLEKYNIKVKTVSSGNECIDIIKKKEKFDMILLDHMMPDLDGIETLKLLKKLKVKLPKIIAVTANSANSNSVDYEAEGFDDYLAKPIDAKELNKIIIKYLKGGKK